MASPTHANNTIKYRSLARSTKYFIDRSSVPALPSDLSLSKFQSKRKSMNESVYRKNAIQSKLKERGLHDSTSLIKRRDRKACNLTTLTYESTTIHKDNPQSPYATLELPLPTTYLQTFNSFCKPQKLQSQQKRIWETTPLFVSLPSQQKHSEESSFTFLDVMSKPFKFCSKGTISSQKQMIEQKQQIRKLKIEMELLEHRHSSALQSIRSGVMDRINHFRSLLSQNASSQQQKKLRFKRDVNLLKESVSEMSGQIKQMMSTNKQLQNTIFSAEVFQLKWHNGSQINDF